MKLISLTLPPDVYRELLSKLRHLGEVEFELNGRRYLDLTGYAATVLYEQEL